jgi:ribonucleoside-diphosphate reductase alpha chain
MKRVMENGEWTLYSPSDVPDLHEKYGRAFEKAYLEYEAKCARGELKLHKKVPAAQLWRKMLTMLFETGHPWLTFKDPCNLRSPQQHTGVVHSSNLCTEITLNTGPDEIAVCNLGSVNMPAHLDMSSGRMDLEKLKRTVGTAMRMLDNVIDLNFYNVNKAELQLQARPVGQHHGLQTACRCCASPTLAGRPSVLRPLDGADRLQRLLGSTDLAEERGLFDLQGLAVGPRDPAGRHAEARRRGTRRLREVRHVDALD